MTYWQLSWLPAQVCWWGGGYCTPFRSLVLVSVLCTSFPGDRLLTGCLVQKLPTKLARTKRLVKPPYIIYIQQIVYCLIIVVSQCYRN
jgi:hypothetical protein